MRYNFIFSAFMVAFFCAFEYLRFISYGIHHNILFLLLIITCFIFIVQYFFHPKKIFNFSKYIEVIYSLSLLFLLSFIFFIVYIALLHIPAVLAYYISGETSDIRMYLIYFYFSTNAKMVFYIATMIFISFVTTMILLNLVSIILQKKIGLWQILDITLKSLLLPLILFLLALIIENIIPSALIMLYPLLAYLYFIIVCIIFSKASS